MFSISQFLDEDLPPCVVANFHGHGGCAETALNGNDDDQPDLKAEASEDFGVDVGFDADSMAVDAHFAFDFPEPAVTVQIGAAPAPREQCDHDAATAAESGDVQFDNSVANVLYPYWQDFDEDPSDLFAAAAPSSVESRPPSSTSTCSICSDPSWSGRVPPLATFTEHIVTLERFSAPSRSVLSLDDWELIKSSGENGKYTYQIQDFSRQRVPASSKFQCRTGRNNGKRSISADSANTSAANTAKCRNAKK